MLYEVITNPVLLWLHGGPGTSEMFINHYCMTKVIDYFTVVHWDQRGTALSNNETITATDISFEKIFDDAVMLTDILKKTFHQDKIFLLGHSFGSVLGIHLIENVITSYSIHYTKLYEFKQKINNEAILILIIVVAIILRFINYFEIPFTHDEFSALFRLKFRITSYNVCYTKLLRDQFDI